jgi:hypothetical protein
MQGARKYSFMFRTGQYGRFYFVSGSHARGRTFHIQFLPKDEQAIPNGPNNFCLNKDAVEVYGVVSGNKGWTESYGWLHKGPWVDDFNKLVMQEDIKLETAKLEAEKTKSEKDRAEEKRIKDLLKDY